MKKILFALILIVSTISCEAQKEVLKTKEISTSSVSQRPKLVVGIVVDQMRYDYLTRFESQHICRRHSGRIRNHADHSLRRN